MTGNGRNLVLAGPSVIGLLKPQYLRKPAIRVMLASLISQPGRSLSDRPHLTVGVVAVHLIAQPDVDPTIPQP
jgi:hypothetical protein